MVTSKEFQEKANKKIYAFIEGIEFILNLLLSKISETSTPDPGDNKEVSELMHKLLRYFKAIKHKKVGTSTEIFV